MQVTIEDLSAVKKMLHIEVPEDQVASEIDSAYKELKKTAKIKGFRPGKTPRNVLERLYKKDINADVTSRLVQTSILEAVKEKDLHILGQPIINPADFDGTGSFKYEAIVEIKPEIPEIDYQGLSLKKNIFKSSSKEVDVQIKALRKKLAKQEPVKDRPIQDGDFVVMDYEGFKDDQPFDPVPKIEDYRLKIGEGVILKDFDNQLIGMKAKDEKKVTLDFPADYQNDKLASQTITYQVVIKEILTEILPEINDDFAKQLGKFNTLDELKTAISDNLVEGYAKKSEQDLHEQVFNAILKKTEFEVPDIMVEYELQGIIADVSRMFTMNNNMMPEQLEQLKETFGAKYRGTAEEQVRRHFILGKIIEQKELELSDEELEEGFKEISKTQNMPIEQINAFYQKDPEKLELYKHALLEKKALNLVVESSTIEEIEHDAEDPEADVAENNEKEDSK